jgi:hypothetical protein
VPSLATARTRLSLAGVPKRPEGSFLSRVTPTDIPVSDTLSVSVTDATPSILAFDSRPGFTAQFSRLGLSATPTLVAGSFVKDIVTLAELNVSDTLFVTFTEDPVDFNELIAGDDLRVSITDLATLRNNLAVTDTLAVGAVETIALLQAGVLTLAVTDTLSVSLTDGVGDIRVEVPVSDTLSVSLNDTAPATVATPLELKNVTDTLSVSFSSETGNLQIFVGIVPLTVFDELRVSVQEEAIGAIVDPVRNIRFTARVPNIRFRVL